MSSTRPNATIPPSLGAGRDTGEQTRKMMVHRVGNTRAIVVPTLRVVAGRDLLRFATMQPGDTIVVGRDESAGLVLTDASVSRRHATVLCRDDASVVVQDLGSTNGTMSRGNLVDRAILTAGETIEFGAVVVRLDLLSIDEVDHLEGVAQRVAAANRCPLTGLLTRAWIEEDLPAVLQRCDAAGRAVSVIFADVDRFKGINDTWGHQTGDDVLVGVARLLMLGAGDTDACVRYGGEELLVFLPGTDVHGALAVAERARTSIQDHDWERTAQQLQVTSSFGVAQRAPGESIKDWIGRADRALYAAKAAGRNCVLPAP